MTYGYSITSLAAGLATLGTLAPVASGVDIINQSSFEVVVSVQGNGLLDRTLSPGQSTTYNLTGGSPTTDRTVEVRTSGLVSIENNWVVEVQADRDGQVFIRETPRPASWGGIPNPYAEGFTTSGEILDVQPPRANEQFRGVSFLASADCQFCNPGDCTDLFQPELSVNPTIVNSMMVNLINQVSGYRGAIMAGDLTQFAQLLELNTYKASIAPNERHVYDGVGNHDVDRLHLSTPRTRVIDYVRDRRRSTMRSNQFQSLPHYSWDWHDVHFVQLNLFAGDLPLPPAPGDDEVISPLFGLSFLINDLAEHVGDSGRPVVLIQHYGFESFSQGWWTDEQRVALWNALDGYNVVLILSGHRHYEPSVSAVARSIMFDEDGSLGRPGIPTFNVGASRNGAFSEIQMNSVNQIRIAVFDENAVEQSHEVFQYTAPIYIDAANETEGFGWRDNPFGQIELGILAKFYPNNFGFYDPDRIPLRIAPGAYDEQLTIRESMILEPDTAGSVIIGRP